MTGDYRAHTEQLRDIQTNFNAVSKNMESLESELQEINDRLNNINKKIDDTGKQFSDNTPLQNIKKSISTVKNDIKSIDIRIGVVSNTLLQLKLKERSKVIEDGKALEILDNEYEIEMWNLCACVSEASNRLIIPRRKEAGRKMDWQFSRKPILCIFCTLEIKSTLSFSNPDMNS